MKSRVGIIPVDLKTSRHGSTALVEDKSKGFHRHGVVALFSFAPGQELFSERLTMVVDGLETSKMICDLYRQHIDECDMYGEELAMLLLSLFCQDSFCDKHFGITASSLIALKTPTSKMVKTANNSGSLYTYGLFMQCAVMRHSCNPNVELTLNERKDGITVRALRHIAQGDELTRDMIAHHYEKVNSQSDHRKKVDEFSKMKDSVNTADMLLGGLPYASRDHMHKQLFGCGCTCFWCMKCQDMAFRKSDDFMRISINSTGYNVDMVDMCAIPDTKMKMLKTLIYLLESSYMASHYCDINALSHAYVQLSASYFMLGDNAKGVEALMIATGYSYICKGRSHEESQNLTLMLKKRDLMVRDVRDLPIFRAGRHSHGSNSGVSTNENGDVRSRQSPVDKYIKCNSSSKNYRSGGSLIGVKTGKSAEKSYAERIAAGLKEDDHDDNLNRDSPSGNMTDSEANSRVGTSVPDTGSPDSTKLHANARNSGGTAPKPPPYSMREYGAVDMNAQHVNNTVSSLRPGTYGGKFIETNIPPPVAVGMGIVGIQGVLQDPSQVAKMHGDGHEIIRCDSPGASVNSVSSSVGSGSVTTNRILAATNSCTKGSRQKAIDYDKLRRSVQHRVTRTPHGVDVFQPIEPCDQDITSMLSTEERDDRSMDDTSVTSLVSIVSAGGRKYYGSVHDHGNGSASNNWIFEKGSHSEFTGGSPSGTRNTAMAGSRMDVFPSNLPGTSVSGSGLKLQSLKPEHLARPQSRIYNNSSNYSGRNAKDASGGAALARLKSQRKTQQVIEKWHKDHELLCPVGKLSCTSPPGKLITAPALSPHNPWESASFGSASGSISSYPNAGVCSYSSAMSTTRGSMGSSSASRLSSYTGIKTSPLRHSTSYQTRKAHEILVKEQLEMRSTISAAHNGQNGLSLTGERMEVVFSEQCDRSVVSALSTTSKNSSNLSVPGLKLSKSQKKKHRQMLKGMGVPPFQDAPSTFGWRYNNNPSETCLAARAPKEPYFYPFNVNTMHLVDRKGEKVGGNVQLNNTQSNDSSNELISISLSKTTSIREESMYDVQVSVNTINSPDASDVHVRCAKNSRPGTADIVIPSIDSDASGDPRNNASSGISEVEFIQDTDNDPAIDMSPLTVSLGKDE